MSDRLYLRLSTDPPTPGEPIGPTVTIAGIFTEQQATDPVWMTVRTQYRVPSWWHPIRRFRVKRWNKLLLQPYTGYSVGIKKADR